MLFGPTIVALGAIVFLCGLSLSFIRATLTVGLLMLVVGGFPGVYTHYLTGGRPGNEGAGLMVSIIYIIIGLPGVLITLVGLGLHAIKRNKKNTEEG